MAFVSDREIAKLNHWYRKKNYPTDILSFSQPVIHEKQKMKFLGDIVISCDTAQKQALKGKQKLEDEIRMLLIHGLLHLLGHDHKNEPQARKMFKLQNDILLHHK